MKYVTAVSLFLLLFAACSTPPQKVEPPFVEYTRPKQTLNLIELQNRVGIQMGIGETGFREKSFDACELGTALNELKVPLTDCHHAYFVLVQFQLSCRQAEESSEVLTDADLTPVRNQALKWQIGKLSGDTQSDFQGQGVIRAISSGPIRKSYLRISTGVDFLNMRVDQVTAIVTPPSWCMN